AAIVDSEEMASYFADAFHMDWFPDEIPPIAIAGPDIDAREGDVVPLDASESSDDRAIVLIWWDFNGDGLADSYGPRIDYAVTAPGEHLVTVHVVDTWGNDASDTMIVRVSGSGVALTAPIMTPCARPPTWILPLALIPVILVLRRLSIRKLNLGKGGS
ncbi:MAG: PKD domain-containing protein, partial [Thermoplasmata archaeon]|nr:PKD domain-containing protein [Thermoplasmata archaeon]